VGLSQTSRGASVTDTEIATTTDTTWAEALAEREETKFTEKGMKQRPNTERASRREMKKAGLAVRKKAGCCAE
jgi:hypothetical protein